MAGYHDRDWHRDDTGDDSERFWASMCHLSGVTFWIGPLVLQLAIPFVIWLLKKEESRFVDEEGREALNFQISMALWLFVIGIASVILWLTIIGIPVAILLWIGWAVVHLVQSIKGALQAREGRSYRYPFTLRFL